MSYRTAVCFDYSQTEGEPLPELIHELTGDVSQYEDLLEAIRRISPVPIDFMAVPGQAYGYFSPSESKIAILSGLSQVQTVKTALHELTHSLLHNKDVLKENQKDRRTIEIEAESTAFVVSSSLGLSVEEYSFPYVASWSSSQSVKELKSSLETIRQTSSHIIDQLQERLSAFQTESSKINSNLMRIRSENADLSAKLENTRRRNDRKQLEQKIQQNNRLLQQGEQLLQRLRVRYGYEDESKLQKNQQLLNQAFRKVRMKEELLHTAKQQVSESKERYLKQKALVPVRIKHLVASYQTRYRQEFTASQLASAIGETMQLVQQVEESILREEEQVEWQQRQQ